PHLIRGYWLPIKQSARYSESAVYVIRMLKRGRIVAIPRFFGIDREGILTIGMTTNMDQRRKQFISGYTRGHGHSAGDLLFRMKRPFVSQFKSVDYEYAFQSVKNAAESRRIEMDLTHTYWRRYGEAPPLTSALAAKKIHFRDKPI